MLRNKTRAIEDINISIALADFRVSPLSVQCKLNDIEYSSFLWSVKFLRNASAHNNCIINSLKAPYQVSLRKNRDILYQVSTIKTISQKSRDTWMKNPVVHDFIVLIYVYLNVIKSDGIKKKGIQDLKWLFDERMVRHKDYFEKNNNIVESYRFTSKCVDTFCNRFRK